MRTIWAAYSGDRDIDRDPYAAPLHAESLKDLPPALVVLGGCDMLRDEGREYAGRLRNDGVDVDEVCYPGQPHGFINFEFPAAGPSLRSHWRLAPLHFQFVNNIRLSARSRKCVATANRKCGHSLHTYLIRPLDDARLRYGVRPTMGSGRHRQILRVNPGSDHNG